MCTFEHDPKTRLPEKAKIIAYKVFGIFSDDNVPKAIRYDFFRSGWNKWDTTKSEENQQGFQVFAKKKDAIEYVKGFSRYNICPVTIYTKSIVKATGDFCLRLRNTTCLIDPTGLKVYEVSSFAIWKKDWKNRKIT